MKVYLISRPSLDWHSFSKFSEDYGFVESRDMSVSDGEYLVEKSGRLCYASYGKGRKSTKEYLANIIAQQHFSVLEHANWTFIITGISRSCSHELVRHRHLSFSQLSQRYVDQNEVGMVCPQEIEEAGLREDWFKYCVLVRELYDNFAERLEKHDLKRKELRTAARCVLPNSTETRIAVTGNARAWREFIQKRAIPAADPEIRKLAEKIRDILHGEAPNLFVDLMPI